MTTPAKGQADYYAPGEWNAMCYECGRKRKSSQLVKTWQGFFVCPGHVNITRHPQDFVRGLPDNQIPPWVQPMSTDVFIATAFFCTEDSDTATFEPMHFLVTETLYPFETES